MKVENVKKTEAVVQVEFTVKMTKEELQDLVTNMGATTLQYLESMGSPEEVARQHVTQYQFFNSILKSL